MDRTNTITDPYLPSTVLILIIHHQYVVLPAVDQSAVNFSVRTQQTSLYLVISSCFFPIRFTWVGVVTKKRIVETNASRMLQPNILLVPTFQNTWDLIRC